MIEGTEQELKYSASSPRRAKVEAMLIRKLFSASINQSLRCLRFLMLYFLKFYDCIPDSDIGIAKQIAKLIDDVGSCFDRKDALFSDSIWRNEITEASMKKACQILTEKVLQSGDRILYEREITKVVREKYTEIVDDKEIVSIDLKYCRCWQNIFLSSSVQEFLSKCEGQVSYLQVRYMLQSSTDNRFLLDSIGFLYIQQAGAFYRIPFSTIFGRTQEYDKLSIESDGEVKVTHFTDELPFHLHFVEEFTGVLELQMQFEFNPKYLKRFVITENELPNLSKESGQVYIESDTFDLYYAYEGKVYRVRYIECSSNSQDSKSYIFFTQEVASRKGLYKDTEEQIPLPTAKMLADLEEYMSTI